jgi:transcriptional regulator with XRE-family HTH domain
MLEILQEVALTRPHVVPQLPLYQRLLDGQNSGRTADDHYTYASQVIIGDRLRTLREAKNLSQGEIEVRTGLLRCYTSRVENGHTVPLVGTLEKYARTLEVPMYHLIYDGDQRPVPPKSRENGSKGPWESSRAGVCLMQKLIPLLAQMNQEDKRLILYIAGKVSRKMRRASRKSRRPVSAASGS